MSSPPPTKDATPTIVEGTPRSRPGAPGTELTPGTLLGRYVLLDVLGVGGMGVVYAAYDPELDRRVALKLVQQAGESPEARARMLREAQSLARLSHPNVVAIYDVGSVGERVFVAMELVDGMTLDVWLSKSERSWDEIVRVFVSAGHGLVAAHAAGIIHRDFKPSNVLVGNDGRVRVMDFGLARAADDLTSNDAIGSSPAALSDDLTRTGSILGTPRYMPPEAYRGKSVGPAGDQFSFCVALYEALYKKPPFASDVALSDDPRWVAAEPPRGSGVPGWVAALVARGLEHDPAARHPSMLALVDALGRDPRRRRRTVLAVALIALAGAGFWGARRVQHARTVTSCEHAGDRIAETWSSGRATTIAAAFAATKISYAADTWTRASERVDRYAKHWQATRSDVCTRAEVDGTMPEETERAALACLDDQRDRLEALLVELEQPDASVIPKAGSATASLPRVETCTDPMQLRYQTPPPAIARPRIIELRARLARASAEAAIGHAAAAIDDARAVQDGATAVGWAPLAIEARLVTGNARRTLGKYDDARVTFEDAFFAAGAAGHEELALPAATALVNTIGERLANPDGGLLWGRHAQMLVDRLDKHDDLEVADLATALASVYLVRGDFAKCLELGARALAIRQRILGDDHPKVAESFTYIGQAHHGRGDRDHALEVWQKALAIWERAYGPDHPNVAGGVGNVGLIELERGNYKAAIAQFQRTIDIQSRTAGPEHPNVGKALNNVGIAYESLGDHASAIAAYERAIAIAEKSEGPDHPDVADDLTDLAVSWNSIGEHAKAIAALERALRIREKAFGPEHPSISATLSTLGESYIAIGDDTKANAVLTRALALAEKTLGKDHPTVATLLVIQAGLYVRKRAFADAVAAYERALVIQERVKEPPERIAVTRKNLADVNATLTKHPARR